MLLQLLMAPVTAYGTNLTVFLEFPSSVAQQTGEEEEGERPSACLAGNYADLLNLQPFATRRTIAHAVADKLIKNKTPISSLNEVQLVFGELCDVMVRDQRDGGLFGEAVEGKIPEPGKGKLDWEDVGIEQGKVARIVHLVRIDNGGREGLDAEFGVLSGVRRFLGTGGELRLRYTIPSLVDAGVKLVRRWKVLHCAGMEGLAGVQAVLRWLHQTIRAFGVTGEALDAAGTKLAEGLASPAEVALRMALQGAQAADVLPAGVTVEDEARRGETGDAEMVYEFVAEVGSLEGVRGLGSLLTLSIFPDELQTGAIDV